MQCCVVGFVGVLFDSVQDQMGVTEDRRKVLIMMMISAIESLLAYGKGTYEDWDRLVHTKKYRGPKMTS